MPKEIGEELRARAVWRVNDYLSEYSSLTAAGAVVAKQIGVEKESVRRWVIQAQVDTGERGGVSRAEPAGIKSLKVKVHRLAEENAVLKAATVFFASMSS